MAAMEHGDTTLQQQFLQLQEQQQQKMARRQQQKKEKDKKVDSAKEEKKATFGVNDDLQLGAPGPSLQTSDYISEELVQHLNDQIRELRDETGRLYKCLSEKDYEIRYLNKKREEDRLTSQCVVTGPNNEVAATKIVELSKKIRELNAEMESERTKTKQYARKCAQLEKELRAQASLSFVNGDRSELVHDAPPPGLVTEAELKTVTDKLRGAENKAAEFKMQHQSLKQEIQKLSKALSQEVGDGYNLQTILGNNSTWRGRQQQILLLQKKVNEMRTELNHYKLSEANQDDTSSMGSATRRQSEESQTRERIRKIERERKEALERSAAELRALEVDHEELKTKFEGGKARNKVLSNELKSVKQQVSAMLDKGKNDDDLIKALMQQLETFKKLADDATNLHQKAVQTSEKHVRELREKTQQDGNVTEQLTVILAQKEEKLHQLEAEVERLKQENLHLSQTQTMNQLFADRHESFDAGEFSPDELDDPELEMLGGNHGNRHGSLDFNNDRELSTLSNSNEQDSKANSNSPSKKKKKRGDSIPGSQGNNRRGSHGNRTESSKSDKKVHFTPRDETDLSTNVPSIDMDGFQECGSTRVPHSPNSRNNSARSIASDSSEKPPRPGSGKRPSSRPPPSPLSRQTSNSYAQRHAQNNIRVHSALQNNRPSSAQKLDLAESETLNRAAEVERDRLNELVSNLQFRINEMTLQVTDVANELQSQKRLNVALEKQLGKSKVEQTSVKGGKKTSSSSSGKMNRSLANLEADLADTELMATEGNIRDLQLSLALQQDENQALKSALQSTLQAKEEDLRLYQETISETRKIFLHGIRNFKKAS